MSKTFKDAPQAKDIRFNIIEEYNEYDELVDVDVRESYSLRNITVTLL